MERDTVLTKAMISGLLEVSRNALLVVDSNNKIIFTNIQTEKIFNTAPDALLGQSFSILFMPDDVDILAQNILINVRVNRKIENDVMFLKRDGETFMGRLFGTYFNWGENQEGMVFSIHDISDMKEIEKSLKHSERIAFLGRLVDDISHQVRNPIVAIGSLARRLQSKYRTSNNVEIMLREASRLEKLLVTMNRFARLPRPTPQKLLFADLVYELETVIGAKVQALGCTWSCYCSDLLLSEEILIDKDLFLEAMFDIAKNSCEAYCHKSTREKQWVRCEIMPSEDDSFPITLKIKDAGTGITDNAREHVFSHFYTDKTGHIGMGLTFARRIIEEQGGQMTIESKPGHGTTVNVHLIKDRRRSQRIMRLNNDKLDSL